MTTNIDRAAEVLRSTNVILPHRGMDAYASAVFARALADAGLLMPDLPEPDAEGYFTTTYAYTAYEGTEIQHDRPAVAWVEEPGIVGLDTGTEAHMDTDEARTVAHALLAAADYAERNQE